MYSLCVLISVREVVFLNAIVIHGQESKRAKKAVLPGWEAWHSSFSPVNHSITGSPSVEKRPDSAFFLRMFSCPVTQRDQHFEKMWLLSSHVLEAAV